MLFRAKDGKIESLKALRDSMAAGNTYVNVHSKANPGGEARGQLEAGLIAFGPCHRKP